MENENKNIGFHLIRFAGDVLLLNGAIILAFLIRFPFKLPEYNFHAYYYLGPVISILGPVLFGFFGLYHTERQKGIEITVSFFVSLCFLTVCKITITYMLGIHSFPRSVFIIAMLLQLVVLSLWRLFLLQWENRLLPPKRILIIAPLTEAGEFYNKLDRDNHFVIGMITEQMAEPGTDTQFKILGEYRDIAAACDGSRPDTIVISSTLPEDVKNLVVLNAMYLDIPVVLNPGLYEIMVSQAQISQIQDTMIFAADTRDYPGREQLKRIFDLVLAFICLILSAPCMLVIMVLIKVDSSGPVFFKQERVSRYEKRFWLYKFRTMVNDAEKQTGPILASKNDPRITLIGRLLRASRLDELPQLINVIKGDMSIVGPRPERPCFVEQYNAEIPEYKLRHLIKPGITGLAQINGKYSTSVKDKLQYDLLYMKNATLLLDLKIILQTVKVALIPDKAS